VNGYTPLASGADVPVWLGHVIARATSAEPADRYPTPSALADALTSRDARVEAGLAALGRDGCVLCGAIDVVGAGVCPTCLAGNRPADAFLFLWPPRSLAERDRALDAAAQLLGADVDPEALAALTSGSRALMRLPFDAERRVVEALAASGLRARVVRERELWRALPAGFQFMVATVVVGGVMAGSIGDAWLAIAAAPFALLLAGGGMLSLRRPLLTAPRHPSALSDATRARIAETFAALPSGTARSLLADVVRRGQAAQRALVLREDSSGIGATVDDLLAVACASARDLAALDESLAQFDREATRIDASGSWLDSLVECERARDGAVQRLLDAVTVLGQLDAQSIRGTDDASARLAELVAEIASEVKARSAARDEVEALLAR
jgi:hypothetical protein